MSGIIDAKVLICEKQLGSCTICMKKDILALAAEMNVRMWTVGGSILCDKCAEYGDVTENLPQTPL